MVRRITNLVAGAVLGLSVIAWAVSYAETSWVSLPGGFGVLLEGGGVYLGRGVRLATQLGRSQAIMVRPPLGMPPFYARTGFVLPLWLPLLLSLAAMWGVWRFGLEGRRRAMAGRCAGCGYDLEGIAGLCPECGGAP